MEVAGSIGMGAVWGWYLGMRARPLHRSAWRHYLFAFLYSAALTALLAFSTSLFTLIPFFSAYLVSFSIHRAWRRRLTAHALPTL